MKAREATVPPRVQARYSSQDDGGLIGGDGRAYPPGTDPAEVPPTRPVGGATEEGTLIYVNGQGEEPLRHRVPPQDAPRHPDRVERDDDFSTIELLAR